MTKPRCSDAATTFRMSLSGNLNCVDLNVRGGGSRWSQDGVVVGSYALSRADNRPAEIAGLSHWAFNCMILTGYPSESRMSPGTSNPFRNQSYSYHREIRFLDHGSVSLDAQIHFTHENVLASTFHVRGTVDLPPIVTVEPTVETWVQRAPGQIAGCFALSWLAAGGERIVAIAESDYRLSNAVPLPQVQHRWIGISASGSLEAFTLHQQSVLLSPQSIEM
jgi:hypothetical protein